MDELTLLRGHDRDVAGPREEVLEASRRTLEAAMSGDHGDAPATGRSRRLPRIPRPHLAPAVERRPITRRGALVGVGAVVATCAAVTLFAVGAVPAPKANAAETLRAAAAAASASTAPPQGVSTHVQQFMGSVLDETGSKNLDQSVLMEWTQTQRPTDDGTDWVRTWSTPHAIRSWGPGAQALVDRTNRETAKEGGADPWYLSSSTPSTFWDGTGPAQIRALPRDPQALLQRLRDTKDDTAGPQTGTERAFYAALDVLGSGLADGELQSATYRALELLPDLHAHWGADIDGRRGVVIGSPPKHGKDDLALIIDPSTGRFLGYTETHVTVVNDAPIGTVEHAAAYYFDR